MRPFKQTNHVGVALLLVVACQLQQVLAKAVFAHFMVEYVGSWDVSKWESEIALAQAAHIDAFALNVRNGDDTAATSVARAFTAAENKGFHLFFSFDYAGGGPWSVIDVETYLNGYGTSAAYYKYNGKVFASTFEGPANASDWVAIKKSTGAFFVPDWSSLGAKSALEVAPGVPDGLFSWAAWPWGNTDSNTYVDASYLQYLEGLPYMMPVSPWFYTNLPGYDKNWLWRGDDLWYDRWQEVLYVQPEWVEILTWNDYGESHYIGPLHDEEMDLFTLGKGTFNYATNMPHDGWRLFLPFVIDMYKTNQSTVTQEGIVAWYRLSPSAACADGNTVGNTHSQLQLEFSPVDVVQDKIFFSALLGSSKSVTVTVGGANLGADWTTKPTGGVGIYHGSVAYGSHTGTVVVTVGSMVFTGEPIAASQCSRVTGQNGLANWNAWVGSTPGASVNAAAPSLTGQVCIRGTGAYNFAGLCSFACQYGYCPVGACTCTAMGNQVTKPGKGTAGYGTVGYPAQGLDASYSGLCSFNCDLGYCPAGVCGTSQYPLVVPTVSDFLPPTCNAGSGVGNLGGLCGYACTYGFCPLHSCTCTSQGPLNVPPPTNGLNGKGAPGLDSFLYDDLCDFTCSRGYCPPGACSYKGNAETGSGVTYGDPGLWGEPNPLILCYPPCTLVYPPWELPPGSTTTIFFPPYTTSLEVGCSTGVTTYTVSAGTVQYVTSEVLLTIITETTVLAIPPVTTTEINFWNQRIPADLNTALLVLTPSVLPPIFTITNDPHAFPASLHCPPVSRTIHPPPWPYVAPSQGGPVTSTSGGPPVYVTYSSSASSAGGGGGGGGGPKPCANCKPGTRCVGPYCDAPGKGANPDPDFEDPEDPDNPYDPSDPYEPDDPECTSQPYSSCDTSCVAGATPSSCATACSTSFTCDGSDVSTVGTQTLAGWGTLVDTEAWPTATPDSGYESSVLASVQSMLNAWYPTYTTPTSAPPPPTTTTRTTTISVTPTPTGSLCLALWSKAFIDEEDEFTYGVFKPGDACTDKNSVEIGGVNTGDACDLGKSDNSNVFSVCGKTARFVNAGPVINNLEKGENCALQLQIDGVNYAGELVDPTASPCAAVCTEGVAFGTSDGRLLFHNVPICM